MHSNEQGMFVSEVPEFAGLYVSERDRGKILTALEAKIYFSKRIIQTRISILLALQYATSLLRAKFVVY